MRNSDKRTALALLVAVLCFNLSAPSARAQSSGGNYKITSSVVAGGGGESTGGGNKVIEGTAGQVAAGGPQVGGATSQTLGFWPTTLGGVANQGGQVTLQFSSASYLVQEDLTTLAVTVTRKGDTSGTATVDYKTIDSGATQKGDFEYAAGRLTFAPGDTIQTLLLLINEDNYVEGDEALTVALSNPTGALLGPQSSATVTITDDTPEPATNPIDSAQSFVHMQYHDFLNREPDAAGLAFWTSVINSCGNDQTCIDSQRVNVSAAFFFSIEFQETGYLVYRLYRVAYGNPPSAPVPIKFSQFMPETQEIGKGVVVNQPGWQQVLENNKQAFTTMFVQRSSFTLTYPTSMSPGQFVDSLFANTGIVPTAAERQAAIGEFAGAQSSADTPARVRTLLRIAVNPVLQQQEFNRAFVLMQYFGYLRRNPNDTPEPGLNYDGYNFWLNKLNQFGGDYVNAEMVKAFINSSEYRQRFGL